MTRQKIGLYGGSFNPVHTGHIQLAREILKLYSLDAVWFVVSPHNPLKDESCLASDEERFNLVDKALLLENNLIASDYEFHLPRPSYMWNTLNSLNADYPDCEFSLIIGADNWSCFPRWYKYEEIIKNYKIIIYPRSGYPIQSLPDTVFLANTSLYDVSSTQIRRNVKQGLPIRGLVPENIEEDVIELYGRY